MQMVICTGDVGSKSNLEWLDTLCSSVHVTRGDFDETSLPESKTVSVGGFKVGVIHSHQVVPWGDPESLCSQARMLGVDLLI